MSDRVHINEQIVSFHWSIVPCNQRAQFLNVMKESKFEERESLKCLLWIKNSANFGQSQTLKSVY